ncbi:Cytochrome oxidase assembly factor COX15 [Klebsormidium nitens]|uniref:Cytochrome oxidase assembly factor COX15 n=1 Tax=Klebsormidium nitens TaxID=105231 RepID=A0A1Y1HYV9_KLENI|nr:Cytochrome oxidase assembly factor COX15 [Klebsormidium nitens]|eukprot:GAQ82379.1 Cytochrome oxidase assembly factor COX15 [Klebsormidium nitens]
MATWFAIQQILRKQLIASFSASPQIVSNTVPFPSSLHHALFIRSVHGPLGAVKSGAQFTPQAMWASRGGVNTPLSRDLKAWSAKLVGVYGSSPLAKSSSLLSSSLTRTVKYGHFSRGFAAGSVRTTLQGFRIAGVKTPLAAATPQFMSTAATATATGLVKGGPVAQKQVAYWLFGCAGWVFSMVVLGGVTRLTRSGLSMTDWRFAGGLPPMTQEEWEEEFDKYKQSPEYKKVNLGMKLDDFKFIYWMEYAHRMWGRALGLVFTVPFAYFAVKGYVTRPLAARLGVLLTLGAGQGLVGWWMVKSGLQEPKSEYDVPRVSPYRLAAHLTSAFVIYSGLLWTALTVASPTPPTLSALASQAGAALRGRIHPLAALIGVTALSGAFVAGLDAGHAFNTFPKMGETWLPPGLFEKQPFLANFFENTATVQLDHRLLALTTLASVTAVWATSRRLPLHPRTKLLLHGLMGMTALQVTLGVSTLLLHVPVSLGSAHQAGALTLFTIVLTLMHSLRRPRPGALKAAAETLTSRRASAGTLQPT